MKFVYLFVISLTLSMPALALEIDLDQTEVPLMSDPGGTFNFGDQENTVFVLEHFSNGCSWCHSNAAYIKALVEEYADDERVQFVDIGADQSERPYRQWIAAHDPAHPVLMDENRELFETLHQRNGTAQAWVLDCNGEFVGWIGERYTDQHIERLRDIIAKAKETVCE